MKLVLIFSAMLASTSAMAADCQAIQNPDARAMCYAKQRIDVGACGSIMDPDMRAYCRRVVTGQGANCDVIADPDKRRQCKAGV